MQYPYARDMGRDECVEVVEVLGPLVEGAVESWLAAARGAAGTPAHLSNVPLDVVRQGCVGCTLLVLGCRLRRSRVLLWVACVFP